MAQRAARRADRARRRRRRRSSATTSSSSGSPTTSCAALSERLAQRGQVLSLDLPLGVHPIGYDVWRHRDQFLQGLSVGAPPDRFFPRGQVWGFPPPSVGRVRADGHAQFRAAIVHHLNVAGMLRIDHVLGTQRLFCVPDGMGARDGVYVRMPLEELLAVVAIEAQRHRAAIVGEDLGTVDAAVRRAMQRDGIRRTSVVQLSIRATGSAPFVPPPAGAVASFSTHDLPTFEGWWRCRDVDERIELGQVDAATGARDAREAARRARPGSRRCSASGDDDGDRGDEPPPEGCWPRRTGALAESDAGVVLVQLDDVLGELEAVNLPGTSTERRNWQRRTALPLEALAGDARLADGARRRARPPPALPTRLDAGRAGEAVATVFGVTPARRARTRRASPRAATRGCSTASARTRWTVDGRARGPTSRCGRRARRGSRSSATSTAGTGTATRSPDARRPGSGRASSPTSGRRALQVPARLDARRRRARQGRPVRAPRRAPAARPRRSPTRRATSGATRRGWRRAPRARRSAPPISIYEVHLGSWRRVPDDAGRSLTYRELAPLLIEHVTRLGFTHVELLPVMEHPFYGSWGYQRPGTSRRPRATATPDDFAALVDELHQAGIGVHPRLGAGALPRRRRSRSRASTARTSTSTPTRAKGVHPDWRSLDLQLRRATRCARSS